MKKISCLLLTLIVSIVPVSFFAADIDYFPLIIESGSDTVSEVPDTTVKYEVHFPVQLDYTFTDSWLYDLSDNGKLDMVFTREYDLERLTDGKGHSWGSPSQFYLTIGNLKMIERSRNWGGPYDFIYCAFVDENNYLHSASPADKYKTPVLRDKDIVWRVDENGRPEPHWVYLRVSPEYIKGKPQISLWLQTSGHRKITNVITVSAEDITEVWNEDISEEDKAIMREYIYSFDGESFERIAGSEEYYEEKEKLESYNDPNTPIDYSPDSLDPRRWDDKEKAIEAYGMYKDENGNLKAVTQITGRLAGGEVNHNVSIKAEFEADLRKTDLSADGKVKATYYVLSLHYGYMPDRKGEVQLLHLEGNKGDVWLASGNIDVRRPNPNVEIDEGNMLTDDSSIYVQFKEIAFDGSRYEYVDGESASEGGLTFRYNDESKIILEGLELKYSGRQAALVPVDEIDYTGGLATFFLNSVYPENYKEIAKEMGIEL